MKAELIYLEILNETEQFMMFAVKYYGKLYGLELTLNTALPVKTQDEQIAALVEKLITMRKADEE